MKTLYKILGSIFCLLLFPIFYFLPLIRVFISSSLSADLMSKIGLPENMSLKYLISVAGNETGSSIVKTIFDAIRDKDSTIGQMFTNMNYLYAAGICLIIALVIALTAVGFIIFSKKYVLTTALTGGSMVFLMVTNKLFDAFAAPMLSGKIGISSLISSAAQTEGADLLGGLFGSLLKLKILEMGASYTAAMFALGIALILGICAIVETRYAK